MPAESFAPRPRVSARYRVFRSLMRAGLRLFYGKTRRLNPGHFPAAGAALAVVSHPAGFLEALLIVAGLEREIHCRLERRLVRGIGRRLLAWGLGMELTAGEDTADARSRLAAGGAVAIFSRAPGPDGSAPPGLALAAHLAAEAKESELRLVPVHLYLPAGRASGRESLIHFDLTLEVRKFLEGPQSEQTLTGTLEEACRRNVFRLQPGDVAHFLADLEEVSKADLAEAWSARSNWAQQPEGFSISGFVAEWVEQMNFLEPGRLVEMRERLSAYREADQRAALRRLKVETAGAWMRSAGRRTLAWAESILTLPVALYGLANHLLPLLLLYAAGLNKKTAQGPQLERRTRWTVGTLVILMCYAGQIFLCAHLWGRAVAGTYALTLPVSGLDLWRYKWLLGRRTRLLLLRALGPLDRRRLRRRRTNFLGTLDAARRAKAQALGLAN